MGVSFLRLAVLAALAPTWSAMGPPGGDVRSLAAHPGSPSVVYLGTVHGTLYRSDDSGGTWSRLEPGLALPGVSLDDLVVAPDGRLWAGFWEVGGSGGGVAVSDDGGHSFTVLDGVAGRPVRALALAPSDPDVVAAGTRDGVVRSDDGGRTWSRVSPPGHAGLRNVGSLAFDPADSRTLYAGTWHLAWKTVDGGRTWQPIHAGMLDDSDVMTLTVDRVDTRHVFATACSGIYRSRDAGAHWSKLAGIPYSARRTRAFVYDPARPDRLYAGTTEGLWVSADGGASWRLAAAEGLAVNAVLPLADGGVLVGTEAEGVLRETGDGRFRASNAGFSERLVARVAFEPGGRLLAAVAGGRGGVFAADWASGRWSRASAGLDGHEVLSLAAGPPRLAGTDDGVFREGPDGWHRLPTVVGGREVHPRVTDLVALAGTTNVILAATDLGLLRSADRGETWTAPGLGLGGAVRALAAAPGGGRVVAATTLGLFSSDDTGRTWRAVSAGPGRYALRQLAFVIDGAALLAATDRGVYRSDDGGSTWLPTSLLDAGLTGLAVAPDGRTVFASDFRREGVYRSDDGGRTFRAMPVDGLGQGRAWTVAVDPDSGRVLASSPVGGLHVLSVSGPGAGAAPAAARN